MHPVKLLASVATAVVWFTVLSLSEGLRSGLFRDEPVSTAIVGCAIAGVLSLVAMTVLIRMGSGSALTAAVVLLVFVALAIVMGGAQISAIQAPRADLTTLLSRGGTSLGVWAAIGASLSVALSSRLGMKSSHPEPAAAAQHESRVR
jgi:hypothetical protein